MTDPVVRCDWANGPVDYERYHDEEWGVRISGDVALFERVCLEGFQSGLSWLTVLRKREAFRVALAGFDPVQLARQGEREVQAHLQNSGLIRHRGKLEAAIGNARALLAAWERSGSNWLSDVFAEHTPSEQSLASQGFKRPAQNVSDLPASTVESAQLSALLRANGFRFVGPTTLYAAMQAVGLVDDHLSTCFRSTSG